MSSTLLSILLFIVATQVGIVIIYHQKSGEHLRQLKYQYGLEALKLKKRLAALQKSILANHDKIDEMKIKIQEMEG